MSFIFFFWFSFFFCLFSLHLFFFQCASLNKNKFCIYFVGSVTVSEEKKTNFQLRLLSEFKKFVLYIIFFFSAITLSFSFLTTNLYYTQSVIVKKGDKLIRQNPTNSRRRKKWKKKTKNKIAQETIEIWSTLFVHHIKLFFL